MTDIDFPYWRSAYLSQTRNPPATAELIRLRDRALVRMRFLDGSIVERILGGGNPLKMNFQGESVTILGLSSTTTITPRGISPGTVEFWVQTARAWNLAKAESFSRMMRQRTGLSRIVVNIEDGWWFVGSTRYPIYNRFLPYWVPPTFEEFKKHHRFFCDDVDGSCMQAGPARTSSGKPRPSGGVTK